MAQQIQLSAAAAARVAAIAARQGKPAILRLSVEGGGCSGFQYQFGLADAAEADDTLAETDGVRAGGRSGKPRSGRRMHG